MVEGFFQQNDVEHVFRRNNIPQTGMNNAKIIPQHN